MSKKVDIDTGSEGKGSHQFSAQADTQEMEERAPVGFFKRTQRRHYSFGSHADYHVRGIAVYQVDGLTSHSVAVKAIEDSSRANGNDLSTAAVVHPVSRFAGEASLAISVRNRYTCRCACPAPCRIVVSGSLQCGLRPDDLLPKE